MERLEIAPWKNIRKHRRGTDEWGWLKGGSTEPGQQISEVRAGRLCHIECVELAAESASVGRGGPGRQIGVGSVMSGK